MRSYTIESMTAHFKLFEMNLSKLNIIVLGAFFNYEENRYSKMNTKNISYYQSPL